MAHAAQIRVLVIHGPNLNLLGLRQPEVYGKMTLDEINAELDVRAQAAGAVVAAVQSNSEGEIVSEIQNAAYTADAIVINAGGYSHTSVAIRDALDSVPLVAVEVHLSNVYRRESFRHTSMVAGACVGQICGLGPSSYYLALDAVLGLVSEAKAQ